MLAAMLVLLQLLQLLPTCLGVQLGPHESPVLLRQGAIRGMRVLTETRQGVLAYLGIPYAEPPIGDLRFSAPARHRGWNGTLVATSFRPACPQPDPQDAAYTPSLGAAGPAAFAAESPQDEDCLFLNVWSPEGASSYRPVPVILVLEGRGFVTGSPSLLPGQDLAAEGVVVVTVAYRLNVFGFLCLGDGGARGNLGLLDQYLALLWVRDNIEAFGGDPRTVTLMGHGSGAVSVELHLTSPRTLGLFQRAVLMSGSALSPWSRSPSPTAASLGVARSLGCPLPPPYPLELRPLRPPSAPTMDCLRTKSTAEILQAFLTQYQAGNWSDLPLPVSESFLPPEEQYLPREGGRALREGAFHQVPIIAGVADQDGTVTLFEQRDLSRQSFVQLKKFILSAAIPAVSKRYGFTNVPIRSLTRAAAAEAEEEEDGVLDALRGQGVEVPVDTTIRSLLEWKYVAPAAQGDTSALMAGLLQMYTDAQFKAPHARQLQTLSSRTTQLFAYKSDQPGPDLVGSGYPGAGFGAELVLLFGPSLTRQLAGRRFTAMEERLAAHLKRMWADFAKTGNPTPGTHGYGATWRRYTETDQAFLSLDAEGGQPLPMRSYVADMDEARATQLWNTFLPRLHNESIGNHRASWVASREAPLTNAQPFRSAMFTLLALVLLLLLLLIMCLVLLKRRAKERGRAPRDSF